MSTLINHFYACRIKKGCHKKFAKRCLLIMSFTLYLMSGNTANAQSFADFALGDHNICAIDTDGHLECTTIFDADTYLPPNDGTLYTSVSSGSAHSCAITQSGELRCWGLNTFGQLDAPASSVAFVSLATGENHSCAIDANTQAFCWGLNTNSQTDVPEPNTGFISVHTGTVSSCGIKNSGEVVCWSTDENITGNIPDTANYIDLIAGNGELGVPSCGLTSNGSIDCWFSSAFASVPPTGGPYTGIAANSIFFCATTRNGSLDCQVRSFDSSPFDNRNRALLEQVSSLAPLTSVEISPRTFPTTSICGLGFDGALHCIGDNLPADTLPGGDQQVEIPQPQNLSFTVYSNNSGELFWQQADVVSVPRFSGYNIYRNDELLTFTTNGSSYFDESLLPNTDYSYSIALISTDGAEGPRSDTVTISTNSENASSSNPEGGSDSQPTSIELENVSLVRYGDNSLEIFWDAPANVTNAVYHVYRNGLFVATAPGASYFDNDVNVNTAYSYTIVAQQSSSGNLAAVGFANAAMSQQ